MIPQRKVGLQRFLCNLLSIGYCTAYFISFCCFCCSGERYSSGPLVNFGRLCFKSGEKDFILAHIKSIQILLIKIMFNVTFISFVLHRQREPFHKYHPEQQDCLDLHLPIKNMQCSFGNRFEGIICPPRKRPRQGQGKLNFTPVQIPNVCFNEYINFKIGNLDIKKNYHQFGR